MFRDAYRIKETSDPKIGSSLRELISADAHGLATNDYFVNHGLMVHSHSSGSKVIFVEVVGDTVGDIQEVLSTNGFETLICYNHICSMYVSIADISTLASLPQVTRIYAPSPPIEAFESTENRRNRDLQVQLPIAVGSVTSEGVVAHNVDKARVKYNVDGTGILIGVLAPSFDCFNTAANDTMSGDLPPSSRITIVSD